MITTRDIKDVPQGKKMHRTGKNTFAIEAEGGHRFEGTFNPKNPPKGVKTSTVMVSGICLKKCKVRDMHCNMCYGFSEYEPEGKNA